MAPDLSILSAEDYRDGSGVPSKWREPSSKPKREDSTGAGVAVGAGTKRKRKKAESPGRGSGEEEKKRSRGRPRLDINDETAADRRRTQIRLAQRAYRDRKESAITTLEEKVKELERTNQEMGLAFAELYQTAISNGLALSTPAFARKMSATMEAFINLSRRSSGTDTVDEDEAKGISDAPSMSSGERSQNDSLEILRAVKVDMTSLSSASGGSSVTAASPTQYGGYIISQEPFPQPEIPDPSPLAGFAAPVTQDPLSFTTTAPQQIYPTTSFSMDTLTTAPSPSPLDLLATAGMDILSGPLSSGFGSAPPLYNQPPLPATYSNLEVSFARHLQRRAVEHCYSLITSPGTPPQTLARVFGFCMLFETTDMIKARLARGMSRTRDEFFNNWAYPCVNLGGAGTYYGSGNMSRASAADPRRPKHGTGFSQGPFNERVSRVMDEKVGPKLKINISGFEDMFFDSEDIQEYLAERGIVLDPGVERVVVEVDIEEFKGGKPDGVDQAKLSDMEEGERLASVMGTRDLQQFVPGVPVQPAPRLRTSGSTAGPAATMPQQWPGTMGETPLGVFGLMSSYPSSTTTPSFGHSTSVTPFAGMVDGPPPPPRREVITLDVNAFIQELVTRGSCLGRTPGFRKGDVNEAFLLAAYRGPAF